MENNYCIRADYKHRGDELFLDTSTRTDEFQDKVYAHALEVAKKFDYKLVADIGCGSGYKLLKYFKAFSTVGYDLPKTVSQLNSKYPEREWRVSDFTVAPKTADLVICADVIEHIFAPNDLLNWIKSMNPKRIIISTPNRDSMCNLLGRPHAGPPANPHHIREWNFTEFENYISQFFNIVSHYEVTKEFCQIIDCKLKP